MPSWNHLETVELHRDDIHWVIEDEEEEEHGKTSHIDMKLSEQRNMIV